MIRLDDIKSPAFLGKKAGRLFLYISLICIAYVFLYPFIYMIITAMKSPEDLIDATVQWIPGGIYFDNFKIAWRELVYPKFFLNSLTVTGLATLGHIIACSLTGYGFARYRSRLTDTLFLLVLFVMIVPVQVLCVSSYMMYSNFGWIETYLPLIVPAFFGFGLRGSLFIFIFRQNFLGMPAELEEAAFIDGCGKLRTFISVALPVARPSLLVSSILSVVWHWNDYVEPNYYVMKQSRKLLPSMLPEMYKLANNGGGGASNSVSEFTFTLGMAMAGTFLVLLPILIFYLLLQRKFMASIERTGLVG